MQLYQFCTYVYKPTASTNPNPSAVISAQILSAFVAVAALAVAKAVGTATVVEAGLGAEVGAGAGAGAGGLADSEGTTLLSDNGMKAFT